VGCLVAFVTLGAAAQMQLGGANQGSAQTSAHGLIGSLPTVSVAALQIPDKAHDHLAKAIAALKANRLAEYERETAKALEIAPKYADVYLLRATHEIGMHRYEQAIEQVAKAQEVEPHAVWAGILLAGAYNGEKRYHDALLILTNLRGAEADTWQAKYEMTRALIGQGDAEASLRWSEMTIAAAPEKCWDVHVLHANALQLMHRWQAAIDEFELYLTVDPQAPSRSAVLARVESLRRTMGETTALENVASR